jgi:aminotransferase EvaB
MSIRVWNYLEEYKDEKSEIHQAINKVLDSGWLILGNEVKSFEAEYAKYIDLEYGIGVNSATDALFLGLKSLGITEGDEVITVSNTAVPTVSAIASTGAKAVFVDIEPDTYLMNVEQLESKITENTKCIIPVHLFGQCVDMDPLMDLAKKYKLFVLEDCAQCHGARYKGISAGSIGNLSATSFYPTKILGGYGDGGMINTSDEELYKKNLKLRFYGMEKTYYAVEHGFNSRLDEMHAAILRNKLNHLDEYVDRRRVLAKRYDEALSITSLTLPIEADHNKHAYYLYVVRHPERDRIMAELKEQDILVNISYPWPIHTMTGYENLGYQEGDLPNTELAAREIFSLPMYPSLKDEEQHKVIDVLLNIS